MVLRARRGAGVRARSRALVRNLRTAPNGATFPPIGGYADGPATTATVRARALIRPDTPCPGAPGVPTRTDRTRPPAGAGGAAHTPTAGIPPPPTLPVK